ncbi:MAG: hypothetical protein ACXQTR_04170 [Candidatus Methanospirareceae archaeon]
MKTKKILAIGIVAILVCGVGLVIAQDQSKEYTVINAPFSTEEGENVYLIPSGSIIYHSTDGITTVYTSDGKPILKARDYDAAMLTIPDGPKPATFVYQFPSGSHISTKEKTEFYAQDKQCILTGKTTTVYLNETVILTIISEERSKSEIIIGLTCMLAVISILFLLIMRNRRKKSASRSRTDKG